MKVGLIHNNLNFSGGAEFVALNILSCLKEMKCDPFLISSKRVDSSLVARNYGLDICLKGEILPVELTFGTVYWNLVLPSLIRKKCDLLLDAYTSSLLPFVDITYIHFFKKIGKFTQRTGTRNHLLNSYYGPYFISQKILSLNASKKLILANSCYVANGIRNLLKINPKVINPPVNTSLFNSLAQSKERIVVTVSRFVGEKNLEIIPEIATKVDAKFVLIGSVYDFETWTEYKKLLALIKKKKVEEKVSVYPSLPLEDKIRFLKKAKVYFHTMRFEDFGIAIVEGMAASCIPVVHNSGGPREFVPQEWLYEDIESACQKIEDALSKWTPVIGCQMAEISQKFSSKKFREQFSISFKEYLFSQRR